ncbi:MAG: IS1380 family transposase, partial [Rhodothermales bacterium]|nr:IS1380 family transposase [Rhodothermales bacterium]
RRTHFPAATCRTQRQWPTPASLHVLLTARNTRYEISERDRGLDVGGIGAMHRLVRRIGLIDAIDRRLKLLKQHRPYHESDHVLNIAYNILCGGTCLDDIEIRRNDEVFLDALGAQRIPDPTTAGDFCRRFSEDNIETLMDIINEARLWVWKEQPKSFFDEAIIEGDGVVAPTTGECKEGMDYSYKGVWGYHPLVISLANTQEPLYLVNRSGNRPSSEGAAVRFDAAIDLCRRAGFRRILLRGDTDFSMSAHLDRWTDAGVRVVLGFDAVPKLQAMAMDLPESAWKPLQRPPKYEVKTRSRLRPPNVKERIVVEREFENIELNSEDVAEFDYRPGKCKRSYRMVVLRKNLTKARGEKEIVDDIRFFFYITNDNHLSDVEESPASEVVFESNARANQENLIEQLKNGVRALNMPVDNLLSNWAYMVIASLAWSLKAWFALALPVKGRWKQKHAKEKSDVLRMEFKRFLHAFMRLPAQVVRTGRRIVFRLLSWNPYQHIFIRAVEAFEQPLLC